MSIRKLLIANRGEIARRIIRTCRRMGIATVAVYSEPDRHLPFVREADEAYLLRGKSSSETYLNGQRILEIAERAQVDAIHPGYGFLAENAGFARAIQAVSEQRQRAGKSPLLFVGPHPEAIEQMGSKAQAKALVETLGLPTVPGFRKRGASLSEFQDAAEAIGYPLLLKAAAGGGGKGMRIVSTPEELPAAYDAARNEALNAFGDDELILERYFSSARHIEFQIFGDKHGQVVHLLERECTIQRRYQKIIEESPSPVLSESDRQAMGETALQIARALRYDNAGTVEFLYVGPGQFYFLEVNTRLQVEHPVTEALTGIDLVEWQIRVAQGEPLPLRQEQIQAQGYAVEARLYAEDPRQDFRPATGRILYWQVPDLPYLRVESAIETGSEVSPFYDPMIAKVIVHAPTRQEGIQRLAYALSHIACVGLPHNQAFLRALCEEEEFQQGLYDTHFLQRKPMLFHAGTLSPERRIAWAVGATLWRLCQVTASRSLLPTFLPNWRNTPQTPLPYGWRIGEEILTVEVQARSPKDFLLKGTGWEGEARVEVHAANTITYEWEGRRFTLQFFISDSEEGLYWVYEPGFGQSEIKLLPRFPVVEAQEEKGSYRAPMPGQVTRILVQPGQEVQKGELLVIFVSMKMENRLQAAEAGKVEAVYVQEGQTVEAGAQLLRILPLP